MLAELAVALTLMPSPGQLLVEAAPFGAALVDQDGRVTRLGEWYETAVSGDRIAGIRGERLAVLDMRGEVLWSIRRRAAQPDWSADGRRIAYVSGSTLRIVRADGGGDRRVARGLAFAGGRWRPGHPAQLAWADRRGRVRLVDVAARRSLWRSGPGTPVRPEGLRWSPDGRRLAAIGGTVTRVFTAGGRVVRRIRSRPGNRVQFGTFTPHGLVLVRHDFRRGRSTVTLAGRRIFSGRGTVGDVTVSPDGRHLLLGRRTADEWRYVPLVEGAAPMIVEGVTRRINPEATGRWAFPHTRGWLPQSSSRTEPSSRATSAA